jgi:hypothetical protein
MTRGPHLAASAGEGEWRRAGGGCRVGWRRNAWPAGPKERRRKRASKGDRGVSADFAHRVSKLKQARKRRGLRNKIKGFWQKEKAETNEFKLKFEFKQPNTMHQHGCTNKFLQFIYFILENLKCLKEIKYHLNILKELNKGF